MVIDLKSWGPQAVPHPSKVYLITDGRYTKVGVAKDVEKRLFILRAGNPVPVEAPIVIQCYFHGRILEQALHRVLTDDGLHVHREWFDATPEQVAGEYLPRVEDEVKTKIKHMS